MKINCLNKISKAGLSLLKDNYEIVEDVNSADAILVRSQAMHDMELDNNVKAIARAGAGVNNIPLDKCAKEGIVVFNTPGANANGVKELVIAGLLLSSRKIVDGINWVTENKEAETIAKDVEKAKSKFAGGEIAGKKLGVIGLGAIGVLVANAAVALGMEVYGCDPFLSVDNARALSKDVNYVKSNEEIYENCDYITIHVPALPDTKGMINKNTIAQMKDGVVVLNFARDVLVNEDDMKEALEANKVACYVTDFPNPKTKYMKNAVVIPHLGASTEESEDNCARMAVKQVMDYLENGNIKNSVNYPALDAGVKKGLRITINHTNMPGIINKVTDVITKKNGNIENMYSKSKGEFAYTILDIDHAIDVDPKEFDHVEGVLRVRVLN